MKRFAAGLLIVAAMAGGAVAAPTPAPDAYSISGNRFFTGQVQLGYFDGVSLHVSGTAANFAAGFPFKVRLGLGYAWVPTGDAVAARRVFIDNATNGTPTGRGKVWDARFDVIYETKLFSLERSQIFGGIRRSDFTAHFEYIGGNETFDVNSSQWGIGGGAETAFALSPRVDMIFSAGADYFFRSTLSGHDTYYRPNNDNTHPIANYTYKDADKAISQPDIQTRLMMGVAYRF